MSWPTPKATSSVFSIAPSDEPDLLSSELLGFPPDGPISTGTLRPTVAAIPDVWSRSQRSD